jgi:hypothetical protein
MKLTPAQIEQFDRRACLLREAVGARRKAA